MTHAQGRPFLDHPLARVLAALVFLGCTLALAYLERADLWPAVADQGAADDPFARCFAERAADIEQMVADNMIDDAQAEQFRSRAEAMCRATVEGAERVPPPLPAQ